MTSPTSGSAAVKVARTVPSGAVSTTVISELYELNTGAQSFSPASVTVTCTRHHHDAALATNKRRPAVAQKAATLTRNHYRLRYRRR